ncbi:MAG: alpha/beta fold hydrolase [Thermaurantiacus sp.]
MTLPSRATLLAGLILLAAAGPGPRDIAATLPDGRTLNLWCAGSGQPTVLLEGGWSADSRGWSRVIGPLAQRSRVCAIDRAGAGRSSPGPLPRDGNAIARDLDEALTAAEIAGPYVLVGHSSGGLYIRHFAMRRPDDIAGMVFVDTSIVHQPRRFAAASGQPRAGSVGPVIRRSRTCLEAARAGPIPADDPELRRCRTSPPERAAERWEARLSEIETLFTTTSDALAGSPLIPPDVPVILLTAARTQPEGPAREFWHGLHLEIAAQSRKGEARVIDSGHLMMNDDPGAIVTAVRDVIVRGGAAPANASRGCAP